MIGGPSCDLCPQTDAKYFYSSNQNRCSHCIDYRRTLEIEEPAPYSVGEYVITHIGNEIVRARIAKIAHREVSGMKHNQYSLHYESLGMTCVIAKFEHDIHPWYPYDFESILDGMISI